MEVRRRRRILVLPVMRGDREVLVTLEPAAGAGAGFWSWCGGNLTPPEPLPERMEPEVRVVWSWAGSLSGGPPPAAEGGPKPDREAVRQIPLGILPSAQGNRGDDGSGLSAGSNRSRGRVRGWPAYPCGG